MTGFDLTSKSNVSLILENLESVSGMLFSSKNRITSYVLKNLSDVECLMDLTGSVLKDFEKEVGESYSSHINGDNGVGYFDLEDLVQDSFNDLWAIIVNLTPTMVSGYLSSVSATLDVFKHQFSTGICTSFPDVSKGSSFGDALPKCVDWESVFSMISTFNSNTNYETTYLCNAVENAFSFSALDYVRTVIGGNFYRNYLSNKYIEVVSSCSKYSIGSKETV